MAEIVEASRSLMGTMGECRQVLTWQEAQEEIRQGINRTWFHGCMGEEVPDELYGKPCEPKWSTDEVRQTVETYGMANIGKANEQDMPFVWGQLKNIYTTICNRKQEDAVNRFVLGQGRLLPSEKHRPQPENAVSAILRTNKGVL